jgi:uncharacterized membrane protein
MTVSFLAALQWYAASGIVTILLWPLTRTLFPGSQDYGWAFARAVSAYLVGYLAWLIASLGLLPWGLPALSIALLLLGLASAAVVLRRREHAFYPRVLKSIVRPELVFAAFFVLVLAIRACKPEIIGLEKFMNWAFINAILNSPQLPPPDPWLAGFPINYYYFGHLVAAGLVLLSGVESSFGYNLMVAQTAAATAVGIFSLIRSLLAGFDPLTRRVASIFAVGGAALTVLAGNLHAVLYGLGRPILASLNVIAWANVRYHFPMSTRFIGHDPPTLDKTITEFPAYAIFVGDLHAHVLNLPVAVALLILCVSLILTRVSVSTILFRKVSGIRRAVLFAQAAIFGVLLAIASMGNAWDVPIYLLALGLCLFVSEFRCGGAFVRSAATAAVGVAVEAALAFTLAAPFWRHFEPFAHGIVLARYGSTLWQLAVLYGNHATIGLCAFVILGRFYFDAAGSPRRAIIATGVLFLFASLLLAVPEIVSVKDIYGEDYLRANTMFKMSFQAYLALGIGSFTAAIMIIAVQRVWLARFGLAFMLTVMTVPQFVFAWFVYDQWLRPPGIASVTLEGSLFLQRDSRDLDFVSYLRAHRPAQGQTILEASGNSYTAAARISTATGIPTVLGWHNHEWLWRGTTTFWQGRAEDVERFYTVADLEWRKAFVRRFQIRFVVLGRFENERYSGLDIEGLKRLGRVVLNPSNSEFLVEIDPALLGE